MISGEGQPMTERLAVVLLLFVFAAIVQRGEFRRMNVRDKIGTAALLVPLVYLIVIFVLQANWPNWSDLLRLVFGPPSERIVSMLKGAV